MSGSRIVELIGVVSGRGANLRLHPDWEGRAELICYLLMLPFPGDFIWPVARVADPDDEWHIWAERWWRGMDVRVINNALSNFLAREPQRWLKLVIRAGTTAREFSVEAPYYVTADDVEAIQGQSGVESCVLRMKGDRQIIQLEVNRLMHQDAILALVAEALVRL